MRTMHYRVSLLTAWLLFFYNLERASNYVSVQPINLLTPYAYVFVACVGLVTLVVPSLYRLPIPVLALGTVGLFLLFKPLFGYPLSGTALPITLIEICAVLVTGLLARKVIGAIREFETSIVNFTIQRVGRQTRTFAFEQGEMYQEVRRARAFNRPLTLMAIEPFVSSFDTAIERMVAEVQRATMKQYVLAALAKRLEDLLGPYSIIAQDGDRFLVLLPEQPGQETPYLVGQVRRQIQEALNLELRIGTASLPEIEMFDELVEAAYANMQIRSEQEFEETGEPGMISVGDHLASG
jgi:GGDEF domain-containing protein